MMKMMITVVIMIIVIMMMMIIKCIVIASVNECLFHCIVKGLKSVLCLFTCNGFCFIIKVFIFLYNFSVLVTE